MTQKEQVVQQLNLTGEVTRNWALQNYITRLGAIIYTLRQEGWQFDEPYYRLYDKGKDYVYKLKLSGISVVEKVESTPVICKEEDYDSWCYQQAML